MKAFIWKKISQPSMRFLGDVHLRSQMGSFKDKVTGSGRYKIKTFFDFSKIFLILSCMKIVFRYNNSYFVKMLNRNVEIVEH